MTDNPPPNGWERVQLVWNAEQSALRDRRDDERTVVGQERDHTKFIVATPIGVSGQRSIRTQTLVLTPVAASCAAGEPTGERKARAKWCQPHEQRLHALPASLRRQEPRGAVRALVGAAAAIRPGRDQLPRAQQDRVSGPALPRPRRRVRRVRARLQRQGRVRCHVRRLPEQPALAASAVSIPSTAAAATPGCAADAAAVFAIGATSSVSSTAVTTPVAAALPPASTATPFAASVFAAALLAATATAAHTAAPVVPTSRTRGRPADAAPAPVCPSVAATARPSPAGAATAPLATAATRPPCPPHARAAVRTSRRTHEQPTQ